jgi:hypothetical protein
MEAESNIMSIQTELKGWIVDLNVDDDGHLTVGINHEDGSRVNAVEEDLSTNDSEWVERFTTGKIEEKYLTSSM